MCKSPLNLVNPRYKKIARVNSFGDKGLYYEILQKYIHKPDYKLNVPCGHCLECLRKRVREWTFRSFYHVLFKDIPLDKCYFCTLSIAPKFYKEAVENPYVVWRRFVDRVRHHKSLIVGYNSKRKPIYRKVKFDYIVVVEFADGKRAKERGLSSTYRMHFHAVLFAPPLNWYQLKDLWDRFVGIGWFDPLQGFEGVAYCLKYIFKDNEEDQTFIDGIDRSKNGKMYVSHGIGKVPDSFKDDLRNYMISNYKNWFQTQINQYRYSIPRYWKNHLFTDEEVKYYNHLFVPKYLADIVHLEYHKESLDERFIRYFNLLNPNQLNYGLNVSYEEASAAFQR